MRRRGSAVRPRTAHEKGDGGHPADGENRRESEQPPSTILRHRRRRWRRLLLPTHLHAYFPAAALVKGTYGACGVAMGVRLSRPTTRLLSCASHPRSPQPPRLAPVYRAVPLPDLPLRGRGAIYYGAVRFFVCECVTSRADSMLNEQNGRGTCESASSAIYDLVIVDVVVVVDDDEDCAADRTPRVDPVEGHTPPVMQERVERWKDFLDRVVKSDGTPTDDKPTQENNVVPHLDASSVSEKDSDPDEPSECYDTEEVGSQKETAQKERRVHQVQIWSQTRPSLTAIEQMMSLRVKKKNFLEGGEQGTKGSRENLAPIKDSKATEDSDDEFYDVERSDPVQELPSGDGGMVGMAGQGEPEDSDFPWKEELECLVHGGLPMALRGELWQAFVGVGARRLDGYYSSLLDQESKTDEKEADAPLIEGDALLKDDTESKPTLPQGIEKWKGQIEKVATIIKCPASIYSQCHDDDGRNALRRLLTAYALHNPSVGYCQVDQLALEDLVRERFPKLGPSPAIVTTKDAGDAITLVQSLAGSTFDSSQLVLTACVGYQTVNEMRLQELRNKHRPSVLAATEERSKGVHVWSDSKGLATKLYSFNRDNGLLVSESKSEENAGDTKAIGDVHFMDANFTNYDGSTLTFDAELDSLPDFQEQHQALGVAWCGKLATWLRVELCRLLEEKRSATLSCMASKFCLFLFNHFHRAEELETALMEMVKQDNRRLLSAKVSDVEQLEQEVIELRQALEDKQEQERAMLEVPQNCFYLYTMIFSFALVKVLMRVEQEQKVTEDARHFAEQDVVAQRHAVHVLQVFSNL
ncbi:hypothetical protein B296_00030884 [Ensete ventricosum]|uniref:Rab-GAP TBC domain-containing protein n=1 Tax=Ensete ventricosum TaxID=4639 RepID=A0A427AHV9_ENSVE|nr:hypothetical protein B296_00030884 [Ensete ventricosum]